MRQDFLILYHLIYEKHIYITIFVLAIFGNLNKNNLLELNFDIFAQDIGFKDISLVMVLTCCIQWNL